jgi:hypothetical protein
VTVKTVPAEVAGAGTNEIIAEFEPAPLTATAVTCEGVGGAAGVGADAGAGAGVDVLSETEAGSDAPPELFATTWSLYDVPDDSPLIVAADTGAVMVLEIGAPPPIGVAVTV